MRPRRPKQYCLQLVIYIHILSNQTDISDAILNKLQSIETRIETGFKALEEKIAALERKVVDETTSQIQTEDRGTQCGTALSGSYGRNREHQKWRYDDLVARMQDKELFVYWLMEEGLLAKEPLCPICAGEMSLSRCEDRSDGFKWECRIQVNFKKHRAELSIRKDSWFEKSWMTLEEILKLSYWWCQDLDQRQIKHELGLGESTGVSGM